MTSTQVLKGKELAGRLAADQVQEGMVVGIGTGSTVKFFIDRLIERWQEGLRFTAVSTSKASEALASSGGIVVVEMDGVDRVDLTVDGADEIDGEKRMIKGGGGALLREKIVAASSQEMVVIVDESKCVERLGAFPLPLEVVPFGALSTQKRVEDLGFKGNWREQKGKRFQTDNGNWILDLPTAHSSLSPEELHMALLQTPGVVDTGYFFGLAGRVFVGRSDGSVEIRP